MAEIPICRQFHRAVSDFESLRFYCNKPDKREEVSRVDIDFILFYFTFYFAQF